MDRSEQLKEVQSLLLKLMNLQSNNMVLFQSLVSTITCLQPSTNLINRVAELEQRVNDLMKFNVDEVTNHLQSQINHLEERIEKTMNDTKAPNPEPPSSTTLSSPSGPRLGFGVKGPFQSHYFGKAGFGKQPEDSK